MNESKYVALIEKIQKRRKWVVALTVIAIILIVLFASPSKIQVMGETVKESQGLHPVFIVILILLCFSFELIAYALVSMPLSTSMDVECDPEKQLILNKHLNKQKNIDHVYAKDYFYLGNYAEALKYADKMIQSPNEQTVLVGLFNRARCEFFTEDYEAVQQTAAQYQSKLSSCQKIKPKIKLTYQKVGHVLDLMCAISENDVEGMNALRGAIEAWNTLKATEGFLNYLKGLAAYKANDSEEAIYRFKAVQEACSKTVLCELSDHYIQSLRDHLSFQDSQESRN